MSSQTSPGAREKLLGSATELFRRKGYSSVSIDEICAAASVSKGGFFYHFKSKEQLGEACLQQWDQFAAAMEASAPFSTESGALAKLTGYMEFYIALFSSPKVLKSCLAGTIAQELGESLGMAAATAACFNSAQTRLQKLLDDACESRGRQLDTAALATLWLATQQGALVLSKANGDPAQISASLNHVKQYILSLFLTKSG